MSLVGSVRTNDELTAADLVDSLLQCFTLTANCDMFYQASEPGNFPWNFHPSERPRAPFPQYVGVRSSYHTLKTRQVLQYLTGEVAKLEAMPEEEQADEQGPDSEEEKRKQECNNKNQDQHRSKQGELSLTSIFGIFLEAAARKPPSLVIFILFCRRFRTF